MMEGGDKCEFHQRSEVAMLHSIRHLPLPLDEACGGADRGK